MKIALIVWYLLLAVGLGMRLALNGKPKTGKYNFIDSLISTAITLTLILWLNGWSWV